MVARFLGELTKFRLLAFGSLFSLLKVHWLHGSTGPLEAKLACLVNRAVLGGKERVMGFTPAHPVIPTKRTMFTFPLWARTATCDDSDPGHQ